MTSDKEIESYRVEVNGRTYEVSFPEEDTGVAEIDGERVKIDAELETPPIHYSFLIDGKSYLVTLEPDDNEYGRYRVHLMGYDYDAEAISSREAYLRDFIRAAGVGKSEGVIKAPMPGLIVKTEVEVGDEVKKGQGVIVMEAMKMENEIKAPMDGTIKSLSVEAGDAVEKNQVLAEIVDEDA